LTSTIERDGSTRMKPRKRMKNQANDPMMIVVSVTVG
jgi:hypothetical protein